MKPDERECPFCCEVIKARAVVCKHCGRDLVGSSDSGPRESQRPGQVLHSIEIADLLMSLVERSLVAADPDSGRFRLLETVRQYSRDRSRECGDDRGARLQHGIYFLELSEALFPLMHGAEHGVMMRRLEAEYPDLRAALMFFRDDPERGEEGLRLVAMLWPYWYLCGHLAEGSDWAREILTHPGGRNPTKNRGNALNAAGNLTAMLGDFEEAKARYEESLAIREELGDRDGAAFCLNNLGSVYRGQGDYPRARSLCEEALAVFRVTGRNLGLAICLNNLGLLAVEQEDHSDSRGFFTESLALFKEIGDVQSVASLIGNLGSVAHAEGDLVNARRLYEESLKIKREVGDRHGESDTFHRLGIISKQEGDPNTARRYFEEALTISRERGDRPGMAHAFENIAALEHEAGRPGRAVRLLAAADLLRSGEHAPRIPGEIPSARERLGILHGSLDEEAFNAALTNGRALPLADAVVLALNDSD